MSALDLARIRSLGAAPVPDRSVLEAPAADLGLSPRRAGDLTVFARHPEAPSASDLDVTPGGVADSALVALGICVGLAWEDRDRHPYPGRAFTIDDITAAARSLQINAAATNHLIGAVRNVLTDSRLFEIGNDHRLRTERFLRTLLERSDAHYVDSVAGVVVAGGFEQELCGRDAAVARARAELERAEQVLSDASDSKLRAVAHRDIAVDTVGRLRAAAELDALRTQEETIERDLATAKQALSGTIALLDDTVSALVGAKVRYTTAAQEHDWLVAALGAARDEENRLLQEIDAANASIARLDVDGWRRAWGGSDEQALTALGGDERHEDSLRKRAGERLVSALERVGVDSSTGDGAPTPQIASVIKARSGLDGEVSPTYEVRRFDTVAQPPVDWLDDQLDHDLAFRDDVEAERQRWNELIVAARQECDTQTDLLERHRDMVEQQIESALAHVSTRYGELDAAAGGYGAQLRWHSTRPALPTDLWAWDVTPEWRRGHGARWLPYTRQANSAMQKQHRTHLVLAALLATQDPAGRVLIVDEAGNDFGREHLRQVLSAFAHVADTHGVTVIAAL